MSNDTLDLAFRYAALIDDRRLDELHTIMLPSIRISGPGYVMDTLPEVERGMCHTIGGPGCTPAANRCAWIPRPAGPPLRCR